MPPYFMPLINRHSHLFSFYLSCSKILSNMRLVDNNSDTDNEVSAVASGGRNSDSDCEVNDGNDNDNDDDSFFSEDD